MTQASKRLGAGSRRPRSVDSKFLSHSTNEPRSGESGSGSAQPSKVPMTAATRKGFEQLLERLQKPAQPGV